MSEQKPTTMSIQQLSQAYGVSAKTFGKWLERCMRKNKEQFKDFKKGERLFTPAQVRAIHAHLGEP